MNRQGAVPQTLRGMPSGFGGQQQQQQQQQPAPQQQGRAVSNRLPNGKLGNNGSSWAFGGGGPPMGSGAFQAQARQLGGNVSFAQSLSGSQPATPLDPSEFPSLSNNPQLGNAPQSSLWSAAGSRNISAPVQQPPSASQHTGQDDLFNPPSGRAPSAQGSFRFGNQSSPSGPGSQAQTSSVDDFPPLNRTANGDTGTDRGASLMSSLGLGSIGTSSGPAPSNRGNGLLNALSANTRANEPRSPPGIGPDQHQGEDDGQQRPPQIREDGPGKRTALEDAALPKLDDDTQEVVDPLAGMPAADKWGIKGLRTLMNNYPDYHAMIVGMDPNSLGLDLGSHDLISSQVYSLFDESLPKPTVHASKFRLPECYNVTNVQPIETKIPSFNEETLFWIFYSCPADVKQQMAAVELYSRNWRWHRKLQLWLTKDELMTPQILSHTHERGYYIVWDTNNWRKDRREITLHYSDLETVVTQPPVGA